MRSLLYKYLAHTIDRTRVYLQRGRSLTERGGERMQTGERIVFAIDFKNGEDAPKDFSSLASLTVLGSVDLYQGQ